MNRSPSLHRAAIWSVCCILGLAILLSAQPVCFANDTLVTGHYRRITGSTVTVRITVGTPAPQSMILEQYLPPGTQVRAMSPPGRQVSNSGVVKWLLKNLSPGSFEVTMQVEPPSAAQTIGGTIRYRDPGSGKMREVRLAR